MSKDLIQRDSHRYGQSKRKWRMAVAACILASVIIAGIGSGRFQGSNPFQWPPGDSMVPSCYPPLPNLLAHNPPKADDSSLSELLKRVDWHLETLAAGNDTDSIAVSIVTSNGPLYEKGFGVARANETEALKRTPPNRDSIYRLASVSKLFTVLETLILSERGILHWDDPVKKYIPEFSPSSESWVAKLEGINQIGKQPRITLRQLASHLSGLSRDMPTNLRKWPGRIATPNNSTKSILPKRQEELHPTTKEILDLVASSPLINKPNTYSIYSNIGFDLLGLANVAANRQASNFPGKEPKAHKELLKRDVFEPLGLNSSFFDNPSPEQHARLVVPQNNSEWADYDFSDAEDAAGGQCGSLADLGRVLSTFLSPNGKDSVIQTSTMEEWLKPVYSWTGTDPLFLTHSPATIEQVGAPWEIRFGSGGEAVYTKGGALPGYYSNVALVPDLSLGIVVLRTGAGSDTANIVLDVLSIIRQFFIDRRRSLLRQYTGTWVSGNDVAEVQTLPFYASNTLVMTRLVVDGVDLLALTNELLTGKVPPPSTPDTRHSVALWYTGNVGEFRLAVAPPSSATRPSCIQYWARVDSGIRANGAPIDLVYWYDGRLVYPSAGVTFERDWSSPNEE